MIALDRLEHLLGGFAGLTIGLVGDLFLDRYLEIDSTLDEPSIETGLTAYQVTRVRHSPGALGTVLNNLAALGVTRVVPVSVIGDDGQAYDLLGTLAALGIGTTHILRDATRLTPTYTKPMRRSASGDWSELNRLDLRTRAQLNAAVAARLSAEIAGVFEAVDGLIVIDQIVEEGQGVVTPGVRELLARLALSDPDKLLFVDSRAHVDQFRCGMLKPNAAECLAAAGLPAEHDDVATLTSAARKFSESTGSNVFCTRGSRGILVVPPKGEATEVPGIAVAGPIDIVGAGDSATAGIVAGLLAGATAVEAAMIGNLVASITVQQLGTTGTARREQVIGRWREIQDRDINDSDADLRV